MLPPALMVFLVSEAAFSFPSSSQNGKTKLLPGSWCLCRDVPRLACSLARVSGLGTSTSCWVAGGDDWKSWVVGDDWRHDFQLAPSAKLLAPNRKVLRGASARQQLLLLHHQDCSSCKTIMLITTATILSTIKTAYYAKNHHSHQHHHHPIHHQDCSSCNQGCSPPPSPQAFPHDDHYQDHSLVSLFDFAAPKVPTALDFVQLAEEMWQF